MSQNTTLQIRQQNPDENDRMAKLEDADGDLYGYLSREVADQFGEYMELELSDEAEVMASFDGVTGSGTGNYARYETPGGAVTGLGISHDVWSEVTGTEVERDEETDEVTNAPEAIGLTFRNSSEEDFEEAEAVDEDEVAALVAGDTEDDSDSEDEEEVEIADEEVGLVE